MTAAHLLVQYVFWLEGCTASRFQFQLKFVPLGRSFRWVVRTNFCMPLGPRAAGGGPSGTQKLIKQICLKRKPRENLAKSSRKPWCSGFYKPWCGVDSCMTKQMGRCHIGNGGLSCLRLLLLLEGRTEQGRSGQGWSQKCWARWFFPIFACRWGPGSAAPAVRRGPQQHAKID